MTLQATVKQLKQLVDAVNHDIEKAVNGNKAASQRVRTNTVRLEKVAKLYRKESIAQEKKTKGNRPARKAGKAAKVSSAKPARRAAAKRTPARASAKPAPKAQKHRSRSSKSAE